MSYDPTLLKPMSIGVPGNKGVAGSDGTNTYLGVWYIGLTVGEGDRCGHAHTGRGQSIFICKPGQGHTAAAENEPLIGANWEDKWELYDEGGLDGTGSGDMVGPSSAVTNDVFGAADVTGKLAKCLGQFSTLVASAIAAFTASTTTTDGDVDKIPVLEAGGQKLKTIDDLMKRKAMLQIPPGAWAMPTNSPAGEPTKEAMAVNGHALYMFSFNSDIKRYACATVKLPKIYDGTGIDVEVAWRSTGTTTNSICLGCNMAMAGDGDAQDAAWGSPVEVIDSAVGAAKRYLFAPTIANVIPANTPLGGKNASHSPLSRSRKF